MSNLDTPLDTAFAPQIDDTIDQQPVIVPDEKRILIVDDNPDLLTIFTLALESTPFIIDTAVDGVDAMEKIQASIPNVMILDVNMPRMDGLEVLSAVRDMPEYEKIKIILLTGNSTVPTYPETSKADLVLSKPVSVEELIHLVNRLAK